MSLQVASKQKNRPEVRSWGGGQTYPNDNQNFCHTIDQQSITLNLFFSREIISKNKSFFCFLPSLIPLQIHFWLLICVNIVFIDIPEQISKLFSDDLSENRVVFGNNQHLVYENQRVFLHKNVTIYLISQTRSH